MTNFKTPNKPFHINVSNINLKPSKEQLDGLTRGQKIKVFCGGIEMWVNITSIQGNKVVGWVISNSHRMDQELEEIGLNANDFVELDKENIFTIHNI
jgi:hypothetical protein